MGSRGCLPWEFPRGCCCPLAGGLLIAKVQASRRIVGCGRCLWRPAVEHQRPQIRKAEGSFGRTWVNFRRPLRHTRSTACGMRHGQWQIVFPDTAPPCALPETTSCEEPRIPVSVFMCVGQPVTAAFSSGSDGGRSRCDDPPRTGPGICPFGPI